MKFRRPPARTAGRSVGTRTAESRGPDTSVPRADRTALLGFWGAVLSALITATVPPLLSGDEASRQPRPAVLTVEVIIVRSNSEGVWLYREPSTQSARRVGPFDGDAVDVVCQRREGEIVSEPNPAPGQPDQSPVWNRLSNGLWVPDLWTSLPKEPGGASPRGMPTC